MSVSGIGGEGVRHRCKRTRIFAGTEVWVSGMIICKGEVGTEVSWRGVMEDAML